MSLTFNPFSYGHYPTQTLLRGTMAPPEILQQLVTHSYRYQALKIQIKDNPIFDKWIEIAYRIKRTQIGMKRKVFLKMIYMYRNFKSWKWPTN